MVQVTSEEKDCPIEHALVQEGKSGWRAAAKGTQMIRQFSTSHKGLFAFG
jgi:hypothetical protein